MKNKNAFTLAELLVVVTLTLIILLAIVALYTTHHQFYNMASIFTELRGETKNFKNQLTKDIEEAAAVATSHVFPGPVTYTTGTTKVVLQCYSIDSGDLETSSYDYIAYYKNGTNIHRVVDADATYDDRGDSDHILVENANSMSFEYFNTSEGDSSSSYPTTTRINIDLVVQKTWAGKVRDEIIHASARLRNKR